MGRGFRLVVMLFTASLIFSGCGSGGDAGGGGDAGDIAGTYSYATSNPVFTGDCDALYILMGCLPGSASCTIAGTSGTIQIEQAGSAIDLIMQGLESSSATTYSGTYSGGLLQASYSTSETSGTCSATMSAEISSSAVTPSGFSGQLGFEFVLSSGCGDYAMNCQGAVDIDATLAASAAARASGLRGKGNIVDAIGALMKAEAQ